MSIYKQSWTLVLPHQTLNLNDNIELDKDDHHYLFHVLRKQEGDFVEISNGIGTKAIGQISKLNKKKAFLVITQVEHFQEPSKKVHLIIGQLKPAALEEAVKLTSEIGVASIHIFKAEQSVSKQELKCDKLQKIAYESMRISKNAFETTVSEYKNLKDCLEYTHNHFNHNAYVFCDEEADQIASMNSIPNKFINLFILIGPESSFSKAEREQINRLKNLFRVSLGQNILRAPTAAVCAVFSAKHANLDLKIECSNK